MRPPRIDTNDDSPFYDSTVDDVRDPHIFVIYDTTQVQTCKGFRSALRVPEAPFSCSFPACCTGEAHSLLIFSEASTLLPQILELTKSISVLLQNPMTEMLFNFVCSHKTRSEYRRESQRRQCDGPPREGLCADVGIGVRIDVGSDNHTSLCGHRSRSSLPLDGFMSVSQSIAEIRPVLQSFLMLECVHHFFLL